ncbi:hypothetical protein SAMN04488038_10117 [Solimonas aquatica]|uniref:Repeat domain-containing protein n=1 Tax=Solimonas aquatica TaxID=489703 RepID=A0A1H8ZEF8_9GAMM|nr:hypothetical protein [Solimonas aquatica]SEP62786.1 hypothetical protein SAMN04488038_10117 [Solimonas aquatica]
MQRTLALLLGCLCTLSATAAPLAQGQAFQVNQYSSGDQQRPALARSPGGGFVLAWDSDGQDGSQNGVYARRYSAQGLPLGNEFQVNEHRDNRQFAPRIAADAVGAFVVVWLSNSQDKIGIQLYARLFDAAGNPRGGEFRVDTDQHPVYTQFDVAMAADGRVVITWIERDNLLGSATVQNKTLYARRYGASGAAQGELITVYQTPLYLLRVPTVAMDGSGNFVLAWFVGADSIWARRYDAAGKARGGSFRVSPADASLIVDRPRIAADFAGNFALAWETGAAGDGSDSGVYLRSYDAGGRALMKATRLDSALLRNPEIALGGAGIVVAAHSSGVYAQCYGLNGAALDQAFRADTAAQPGTSLFADVAADASGNLVFAWQNFGDDGSGRGVFARLFSAC